MFLFEFMWKITLFPLKKCITSHFFKGKNATLPKVQNFREGDIDIPIAVECAQTVKKQPRPSFKVINPIYQSTQENEQKRGH